ncbi:MAG: ribosome biogenesis GTP-binding protein YsxC [Bdellovibrionales bacterium]|nr:ribosome biogenesis GTP-binding protein YsxC [Bdellovibrionales bacterium]
MIGAMKITFLQSAKEAVHFPTPNRPEVALAGRSNAGKSSFLNALANQKVARVSAEPGKTRLLNFFEAGESYRLVDMPGYGYASRSGGEIVSWQTMVESYLMKRECLVGLVLIMDIRRPWADEEQMILEFCASRELPCLVVLNKADKLGRGERSKQQKAIAQVVGPENVFCASALKKQGIEEIEEAVYDRWIKSWQKEET